MLNPQIAQGRGDADEAADGSAWGRAECGGRAARPWHSDPGLIPEF
ncbi:hypothetical protein [Mycobacteroides abscessus]|nr:hypothetical protein [Mycobacteroides abscessus]